MEEDFEFGKDCFGLDQCQARLYTAIPRHVVLVMAALAICAVTAAWLRDRTDTQAPPPVTPVRPRRRPRDDPADRPGDQAPARSSPHHGASPAVTPPAGSPGDAATRHDPDGSTSAHD